MVQFRELLTTRVVRWRGNRSINNFGRNKKEKGIKRHVMRNDENRFNNQKLLKQDQNKFMNPFWS